MGKNYDMKSQVLTTENGVPIVDPRGPVSPQDVRLIKQIQHFNRERIPECVVYAKGSGTYKTFTMTDGVTRYTNAKGLTAGHSGGYR